MPEASPLEFFLTVRADRTLLALLARLIDIGQQIIKKDAIFNGATANTAAITAAMAINVPPAPPPAAVPTVV
jgi:hypothetical protein